LRKVTTQTLIKEEFEDLSGGLAPATLAGIAAYIYVAVGDDEGIDKYLNDSIDSAKSSIDYWFG